MMWLKSLELIAFLTAKGQDEQCSARQQSEVQLAGRVCKKACQTNNDCSAPRECVCDGVCGLSCINTGKVKMRVYHVCDFSCINTHLDNLIVYGDWSVVSVQVKWMW